MLALTRAHPTDILRPDVNVVCLGGKRARAPPGLEAALRSLPEFSRTVRTSRAGLAAAAAVLLEPLRHMGLRAALQEQLVDIAREYCDVMGYDEVDASVESLKGVMCPRFHADVVAVRCLCTLCGPGTEWVEDWHVDRTRLRSLPHGDLVGWSAIAGPTAVHAAAAGQVLYLKGSAFPGAEGRGAVHRSPEGASAATPRLLFKLDPPSSPAGDASVGQPEGLLDERRPGGGKHAGCAAGCAH